MSLLKLFIYNICSSFCRGTSTRWQRTGLFLLLPV